MVKDESDQVEGGYVVILMSVAVAHCCHCCSVRFVALRNVYRFYP